MKEKEFDINSFYSSDIEPKWAKLNECYKFRNYKLTDSIILAENLKQSILFVDKLDCLNEIVRVGKELYSIFEEKIKNEKNNTKKVNNMEFLELKPSDQKTINNEYINNFFPISFLEKDRLNKAKAIIENYCKKNGLPFGEYNFIDYEDENGKIKEIFTGFCSIQNFIALTISIYIIFEVQLEIKDIIETFREYINENKKSNIKSKIKTSGRICEMFEDSIYCVKKNLENLQKFLFFFNIQKDNIEELDLYELCLSLCDKINYIEETSNYLQSKNKINFISFANKKYYKNIAYLKFFESSEYDSIICVAWQELKNSIIVKNDLEITNCKECGKMIKIKKGTKPFCKKHINRNYAYNSKKNYLKMKNMHDELITLYNNIDKEKLSQLDDKTLSDIKKYSSLSITQLKSLKDDKKMYNMDTLIKKLNSLN